MDWLGFSKIIDEEGNTIGWHYEGIGKTINNIYKSWAKLNPIAKTFVGLGLAVVFTKIATAVAKVYKAFKDLNIVKNITTLFKWLVKDGLTPTLDVMVSSLSATQRFGIGLAGLVSAGGGLYMLVNAIKTIKQDGLDFANVMKLIEGAIILVGGAITTVSMIMGGFSTTMALATGGISLLVGAIAGVVTWFATKKEKVEETTTAVQNYKNAIQEVEEAQESETLTLESKVGRIQQLKDELLSLVDTNGNLVGSQDEVGEKLNTLNELMGTKYEITNGQITLNGKLVKTNEDLKKTIDNYCNSLRAEGYLEIKRAEYNKRLEQKLKLEDEINKKINELANTQSKYDTSTTEGYLQWKKDNASKINELGRLKSEYETNEQYLKNYEQAGYLISVGRYNEAQDLLTDTVAKVGVSTQETIELIDKKTGKIPETVQKAIKEIDNMTPKVTVTVNADTRNFQRQIQSVTSGMSIRLNTSAYASGGFVNQGELFVAREAGPEMVGQINGHTAVANNDQIVKGIQSGVFSAMMSALSSQDFGGTTIIEATGDTEGLMNFISFKQKQQDRQFN